MERMVVRLRSFIRRHEREGGNRVGRRPLPYGETSDQIFTIDASAMVTWSHYELRLLSTNLLDNKVATFVGVPKTGRFLLTRLQYTY